jgi:hypothetical protein
MQTQDRLTPAERGERYARLFRKAGAFLAKGETERALKALSEGEGLARRLGDRSMARRFAREVRRLQSA